MANLSRPQRWAAATAAAQEALASMREGADAFDAAMSDLNDLRSEYEDWRDNLPEMLESSPVAEKLDAVCELDFEVEAAESTFDELETLIGEAESADLPRGFGRD